ncbi:MAG: hypothetical protein SVR81_02810 [Chloroflexota bacterium]|nr:hypothetical protein [Chloroflexota bacterium]
MHIKEALQGFLCYGKEMSAKKYLTFMHLNHGILGFDVGLGVYFSRPGHHAQVNFGFGEGF